MSGASLSDATGFCLDCRFWDRTKGAKSAPCRVDAPALRTDASGKPRLSAWPTTAITDWCGRYSPKPQLEAAEHK